MGRGHHRLPERGQLPAGDQPARDGDRRFQRLGSSPTLEQFQAYVAQGKIHYFIGGEMGGRQNGGSEAASDIVAWVEANYEATTIGSTTVYDLSGT